MRGSSEGLCRMIYGYVWVRGDMDEVQGFGLGDRGLRNHVTFFWDVRYRVSRFGA